MCSRRVAPPAALRLCACLVLVQASAAHRPLPLRANVNSSAELPSWYPSTRCSAGASDVTLTDPTEAPTDPTEAPMDQTEAPTDPMDQTEAPTDLTEAPMDPMDPAEGEAVEDLAEPTAATTTTTGEPYRAPPPPAWPAHYLDDE